MQRSRNLLIGILIALVVLLCCCVSLIGVVLALRPVQPRVNLTPTPIAREVEPAASSTDLPSTQPSPGLVTATPAPTKQFLPTKTPLPPSFTPTVAPILQVTVITDTLHTLEKAEVPMSDLVDLAERLQGKTNIPATVTSPVKPYQVGVQQVFWASNVDTHQNFQVNATLQYETAHVYFWVEDGVSFIDQDLRNLVDTFENKIYPTDRAFFGSEWSPGIDGDPHLYILYVRNLGKNLAGYFSSSDEYTPQAHKFSNAHEMFLLNADNLDLAEKFTYGTLAHEFQHMIHWYRDRDETAWVNEGFSELASLLNGYYEDGFDTLFARNPDLELNDWPNDRNKTTPHYGASFLFLTYFLDRFGEQATKDLVADPLNGLEGIDDVLTTIRAKDPGTGAPIRANDVFLDWTITNYLQDPSVAKGRFTYKSYANPPSFKPTETVRRCPLASRDRQVYQYAVDYIRITCQGDYTLHFQGNTRVGVLDTIVHSGKYTFWSNKGDESDMTLTQSFDFTNTPGPMDMSYWTWYDLEKDYDYLYLEASTDGKTWSIIRTPSGTDEDPSGNSYGWGYNGTSGGQQSPVWIQEDVDLSQYAGKVVKLRFEYVTDAAVNGEGLLLDDIAIPAIGYSTDFEKDDGGWEAAGWVRIQNALPQSYRLGLITIGNQKNVQEINVPASNVMDIPLHISGDVKEVVLVVTGTTRFTRQKADYQYEIQP